jgi:GTPase Era involved in 16S rRNA processing
MPAPDLDVAGRPGSGVSTLANHTLGAVLTETG